MIKYLKNYNNFGDNLNSVIARWIFGEEQPSIDIIDTTNETNYLLVGSTLEHADKNTIVWGAGFIEENAICVKPKEIRAVRGPLTRKRLLELGIACPEVYGDPALLLPRFYNPKIKKKYRVGIVPHENDNTEYSLGGDDRIVNIRQWLGFVDDILECERIESSCLHGLIVADAYGIPSKWIESDKVRGEGFKFRDYFASNPDLDKLWEVRPR